MAERQRRYSDEERQEAMALLAANNNNVSRTAIMLRIPVRTLQGWSSGERHAELAQSSQEKKESLASRLEEIVGMIAEGLDNPEKVEVTPLPQIATTLGIIIDKIGVLRGENRQGEAVAGAVPKVLREILDPNTSRDRIASVAARSGIKVPSDFVSGVTCNVPIRPVPAA